MRVVIGEDLFLLRDGLVRLLEAHGFDIAAAVGFLCSEEAGFITGQVLGVNGGAVM